MFSIDSIDSNTIHHRRLYDASKEGDTNNVKLLIKSGVDVNCVCNYGSTPLRVAVDQGHTDIVKLLIDADINVNFPDATSFYVTEHGYIYISKGCFVNSVNTPIKINSLIHFVRTPLFIAINKGYTDIVKLLIKAGANVNCADYDGITPLMYASGRCKNTDIVKLLIKAGANVNSVDFYDNTPLHYESDQCNVDIVKVFIKNGANVNSINSKGCNPLHYAIKICINQKYIDTIKILLNRMMY